MRTITIRAITPLLLICAMSTAAAGEDTVKLGYPLTPVGALAVVAEQTELWSKNGLKVESVPFAAAINVRDALVGGRVDVGITGLSNFLVGASEAGMLALGVAADQCASTAILVKPDSPIRSITDLKGKRVASQTGTVTHGAFVNRVLKSAGIAVSDLEMVNLRFQDMISALSAGSVDAVTAVDPFLSSAEHANAGVIVSDFCPYGRVPLIFAASENFMKNQDVVRKLITAWQDAAKLFVSEPQRTAQIYADSLKARGYELPPEVVLKIVQRLNVKPATILFSPEFLAYVGEEASFMQQSGQLARVPDLGVSFPKQPVN